MKKKGGTTIGGDNGGGTALGDAARSTMAKVAGDPGPVLYRKIPASKLRDFLQLMQHLARTKEVEYAMEIEARENQDNELRLKTKFYEGEEGIVGHDFPRTVIIMAHTHPVSSKRDLRMMAADSGVSVSEVKKRDRETRFVPSPADVIGSINPKRPSFQAGLVVFPDGVVLTRRTERTNRIIRKKFASETTGKFSAMKFEEFEEELDNKFARLMDENGVLNPEARKAYGGSAPFWFDYSAPVSNFKKFREAWYDLVRRETGLEVSLHSIRTLPDLDVFIF